jgi:ribonuclease Z
MKLISAISALTIAACCSSSALLTVQTGVPRAARVGLLSDYEQFGASASPSDWLGTFRAGLRDLGYVQGNNVLLESRYANRDPEKLARMAAELAAMKVDVIVAASTTAAKAAKAATHSIPIVFWGAEPVSSGLVANLDHPGENLTGVTANEEEQKEFLVQLKEVIPDLTRVALLFNRSYAPVPGILKHAESGAGELGLSTQLVEVTDPGDLPAAFAAMKREGSRAVLVLNHRMFFEERAKLAALAIENGVAVSTPYLPNPEAGALIAHEPDFDQVWRISAGYVDRILKGAKPGDLPVHRVSAVRYAINVKTAKALGLPIPGSLLKRAAMVTPDSVTREASSNQNLELSKEQTQPTRTPAFRVTLLGTGGPAPRIERFGPSTLVQAGDKLFLFDCGRGAAQRLFQLGKLREVNALFLTHLHSDHVVGIPDLWLTGWFEKRSTALQIWGPTGTQDMASHLRQAYKFDIQIRSGAPEHLPASGVPVTANDITEGTVYDDGAVKIEAFNVDHGPVKPALGYTIHYGGRSVVVSGDTRPSENLIRSAKGADVLIHGGIVVPEPQRNSDRARAALQLLATAEEAGQVFDRVKPRLALYTHYNTADDLVARTRKIYSGPLEVGDDLMTVEVGAQIQVQRWQGDNKNTNRDIQAEKEILGLEEERRQAILHNDAPAMDRLLAEEFMVTDTEGRVHDRADELSLYQKARRQTQSWEPTDVRVRVFGDAAVVTERVAVKDVLDGKPRNVQFRLTNTWIKRNGTWYVVARQATPIAQHSAQ